MVFEMRELFLLGILEDFNLVLKIFVLIAIISFVLSHLGKNKVTIVLIGIISIFIFSDYWKFFGGIYLLYMLFVLGIAGVFIDFFFVSGMGGGETSPVDSGRDIINRQKEILRRQKAANAMKGQLARMRGGR